MVSFPGSLVKWSQRLDCQARTKPRNTCYLSKGLSWEPVRAQTGGVEPEAIQSYLSCLEQPGAGLVPGRQKVCWQGTQLPWFQGQG